MTEPEDRGTTADELVASLGGASEEQWRTLDELLEVIEERDTPSYTTHSPQLQSDGITAFGWFEYSDEVSRVIEICYDVGIVSPLAGGSSSYASDRYPDVESLENADPADLIRLATEIIRGDRFSEGVIAAHLDNGVLVAALRRLVEEVGSSE